MTFFKQTMAVIIWTKKTQTKPKQQQEQQQKTTPKRRKTPVLRMSMLVKSRGKHTRELLQGKQNKQPGLQILSFYKAKASKVKEGILWE